MLKYLKATGHGSAISKVVQQKKKIHYIWGEGEKGGQRKQEHTNVAKY